MSNDIIRFKRLQDLCNALIKENNRRNYSGNVLLTPENYDIASNNKPIAAWFIKQVRDQLDVIKTQNYTDNPLVPNKTIIKDIHFSEIENAVKTLAAHPKVGGSSDCNSGCVGLCVSCTGTCTGGCTSCTSCSGCTGDCFSGCEGNSAGGGCACRGMGD